MLFVNLLVDITGKPGFINLGVIFGNNVWLTLNSFPNLYTGCVTRNDWLVFCNFLITEKRQNLDFWGMESNYM